MFMIFFSEVVIYVLFNIKYNVFNSLICEVKNSMILRTDC